MVGLIDDLAHVTRSAFQHDGDTILLLGEMAGELGGSEYLATIHGEVVGAPPRCDPAREKAVIDALLESIQSGAVSSAHDCSDGGLAVALSECCISNIDCLSGAEVDLSCFNGFTDRAILFGETQGRIVISSAAPERVMEIAKRHGVDCTQIGRVRRHSDILEVTLPKSSLRAPLARLKSAYHDTIPSIMSRTPEHATFDELSQVAAH